MRLVDIELGGGDPKVNITHEALVPRCMQRECDVFVLLKVGLPQRCTRKGVHVIASSSKSKVRIKTLYPEALASHKHM